MRTKMEENNNAQRLKSADWQGYVRRALEGFGVDLLDIKDRIRDLDKRLRSMQIKVAGIGAVVALIVTLVINLVMK